MPKMIKKSSNERLQFLLERPQHKGTRVKSLILPLNERSNSPMTMLVLLFILTYKYREDRDMYKNDMTLIYSLRNNQD